MLCSVRHDGSKASQGMSDLMLARVARLCPALLHLHITEPTVPTAHMLDLTFNLPLLEELEVVSARAARVTVNCPALQRLMMRRLVSHLSRERAMEARGQELHVGARCRWPRRWRSTART
jgi:hypothetical protein